MADDMQNYRSLVTAATPDVIAGLDLVKSNRFKNMP